jgi:hypothetical protein
LCRRKAPTTIARPVNFFSSQGADYRLDDIGQKEAQWAMQIAQEVITLAEQKEAKDEAKDEEG